MTAITLERETNNYWNLIKDAGNEVKLALIKRLSDALAPAVAEKKTRRGTTSTTWLRRTSTRPSAMPAT